MKFFVIACLATQLITANSKVLTGLGAPCSKENSNYKTCLQNKFNNWMLSIPKGVPQLQKDLVDPLDVTLIHVNGTVNQLTNLTAVVENAKITGLSKAIVGGLKTDVENLAGQFDAHYPLIQVAAKYGVSGPLLGHQTDSQGFYEGNYYKVDIHFKVSFKKVEKQGVKYLTVNTFKLKTKVEDGSAKLISKNIEEQPISDALVTFTNQNSKEILNVVNPYFTEVFEDIFRSLVERALANMPAEKFLEK